MGCSLPGSSVHGDAPGTNTGVGCHALQGIIPTQGLNPGRPRCRQILYCLSHQGSQRRLATAAKLLQSCPTLCDPIDGSPPGSPRPWDSPGKNTGVNHHFLLQSCQTLRDPVDCSLPGSSVHGIFQARVLEWGAIAFSRRILEWVAYPFFSRTSPPRNQMGLLHCRWILDSIINWAGYLISDSKGVRKIKNLRMSIVEKWLYISTLRAFSVALWYKDLFNVTQLPKGEDNGNPLQYSCLENPMDGGAWWAAIHGVSKGRTWLSDFTFTFHFHALEKEMATHSSVLAWRIPGMAEPGGLPSMGSHRVGHDWSDLAAAAATAQRIKFPDNILNM